MCVLNTYYACKSFTHDSLMFDITLSTYIHLTRSIVMDNNDYYMCIWMVMQQFKLQKLMVNVKCFLLTESFANRTKVSTSTDKPAEALSINDPVSLVGLEGCISGFLKNFFTSSFKKLIVYL